MPMPMLANYDAIARVTVKNSDLMLIVNPHDKLD